MMRDKFSTRTFLLRDETTRERAIALINKLPIDPDNPLELVIREEVKARRLAQNAYYWLRLGEIADQAYFEKRKYGADVWHEYCRRNIMPDEIKLKDGTVRAKWIEVPRGSPAIISTTELEKQCFANYVTAVEAFGASLGVRFSANPMNF